MSSTLARIDACTPTKKPASALVHGEVILVAGAGKRAVVKKGRAKAFLAYPKRGLQAPEAMPTGEVTVIARMNGGVFSDPSARSDEAKALVGERKAAKAQAKMSKAQAIEALLALLAE
jgi:hypothetical protein